MRTTGEDAESGSSSGLSSAEQLELDELNELCDTLRKKVKTFKRKLEQLETKHMQEVFANRGFQQKANSNFSKIKIEILEQIVKSQAIQDIINGHLSPKKKEKSPRRGPNEKG